MPLARADPGSSGREPLGEGAAVLRPSTHAPGLTAVPLEPVTKGPGHSVSTSFLKGKYVEIRDLTTSEKRSQVSQMDSHLSVEPLGAVPRVISSTCPGCSGAREQQDSHARPCSPSPSRRHQAHRTPGLGRSSDQDTPACLPESLRWTGRLGTWNPIPSRTCPRHQAVHSPRTGVARGRVLCGCAWRRLLGTD